MKLPLSKRWLAATQGDRAPEAKPEPEAGLRKESLRILTMAYLLVGIILVVDIVAVYNHYSAKQAVEVPSEILGTWTTNAPGYEDRALEITATSLIFHAGESGRLEYSIDRIRAEHLESTTSYTLLYGGEQEQQTLAFDYRFGAGETIRLRNQRHRTWRKHSIN